MSGRNLKRYTAEVDKVSTAQRRRHWYADYPHLYPPMLRARLRGVTERVGYSGDVESSVIARWILDHDFIG